MDLKDETRALLEATCHETGLECLPISHLKDASLLWLPSSMVAAVLGSPKRRSRRLAVAAVVLALLLAGSTAAVIWLRTPAPAMAASWEDCVDPRTGTVATGPVAAASGQGHADFGLNVQLNGAVPVYAIGDPVTISIAVGRTAYIKALSLDRDSKVVTVFPNKYQTNSLLLPGQAVTIKLSAAAPAGSTLLKVIAMGAPFKDVLGPDAPALPNPEYLLSDGQWQEKAVCLKITT
jgi:hypothetical protein